MQRVGRSHHLHLQRARRLLPTPSDRLVVRVVIRAEPLHIRAFVPVELLAVRCHRDNPGSATLVRPYIHQHLLHLHAIQPAQRKRRRVFRRDATLTARIVIRRLHILRPRTFRFHSSFVLHRQRHHRTQQKQQYSHVYKIFGANLQ